MPFIIQQLHHKDDKTRLLFTATHHTNEQSPKKPQEFLKNPRPRAFECSISHPHTLPRTGWGPRGTTGLPPRGWHLYISSCLWHISRIQRKVKGCQQHHHRHQQCQCPHFPKSSSTPCMKNDVIFAKISFGLSDLRSLIPHRWIYRDIFHERRFSI